MMMSLSANIAWTILAGALGLLTLVGLALWQAGSGPARQARAAGLAPLLSLAVGMVAFFAVGFAFAFGGVGDSFPTLGDLSILDQEWLPLRTIWGPGWGLIGLKGFFLADAAYPPGVLTLFFFQAVLLLVALTSVSGSRPLPAWGSVAFAAIFAGVFYPLLVNWGWGGGWLSQLGVSLGLGHGFVDYGGAGLVHGAAGLATLALAMVAGRRPSPTTPETATPWLAILGLITTSVGWLILLLGNTFSQSDPLLAPLAVNGLLAAAAGALAAGVYMAFTTGRADGRLIGRGLLAGLVALSGPGVFVSPAGALLTGLVAGGLVCLGTYLVEAIWQLEERPGVIVTQGIAGLWGLLAVGLLADGRAGAGWNGIGLHNYLGIAGQGVSGLWVAAGFVADSNQLLAQGLGVLALLGIAFAGSWLIGRGLRWIGWF